MWILILFAFSVGNYIATEPVESEKPQRVQNALPLSTSIIRGDYGNIHTEQRMARDEFERIVEASPYEVDILNVKYFFTPDGFIVKIVPAFSTRRKTIHTQYRYLAFVSSDKEFVTYLTSGFEAFEHEVIRNDEVFESGAELTAPVGGTEVPVLILIKTKSILTKT